MINLRVVLKISLVVMLALFSSASNTGTVSPTSEDKIISRGVATDVQSLISILENQQLESELRYHSSIVLGQKQDPVALPALLSALKDTDQDVRLGAMIGLRELALADAIPALREKLKTSKDTTFRQIAVSALARIDNDEAIDTLVEAAMDTSQLSNVRVDAVEAIVRVRPSLTNSGSLHVLLDDRDKNVRATVAVAIAAAKDKSAVAYLAEAIFDSETSESLRIDAIRELEVLTGQEFGFLTTIGLSDGKPIRHYKESASRNEALQNLSVWWENNRKHYSK